MIISRQKRRLLHGALTIGLCLSAGLPAHAADDNDGIWAIFTSSGSFPSSHNPGRWRYWFDAQARYFDLGSGINQFLVRPGIGFDISEDLSAWMGYARLRARSRSGNVADENRYWQQLSWTAGRWKSSTLSIRTRLEQRSLTTGDDLGIVLRFQTKYVRPMGNDGRRYLSLGIEPFIDLKDTDWGGNSGLGQNRISLGLGWRISDTLSIEAGYMNQYVWVDSGENRVNHLVVLNLKMKP